MVSRRTKSSNNRNKIKLNLSQLLNQNAVLHNLQFYYLFKEKNFWMFYAELNLWSTIWL